MSDNAPPAQRYAKEASEVDDAWPKRRRALHLGESIHRLTRAQQSDWAALAIVEAEFFR
jgi:hypothetical protein